MNIRLRGNSFSCHNFTDQKLTSFILDCLLNRSEIDCTEGNLFKSTKVRVLILPIASPGYYPGPETAELFHRGVEVISSNLLRMLYDDLIQGKLLDIKPNMMDGVIINIMQESIEHPNSFAIALDLKDDAIIQVIAATGYRELETFKKGFGYKPFHGIPFHLSPELMFVFLDKLGKTGVGIKARNKETHYDVMRLFVNNPFSNLPEKNLGTMVRSSILSLELNKVIANLLGDDDNSLGFLSNWSTEIFDMLSEFKQGIPDLYHNHPAINEKFNKNLNTFIKEYGSIAATALKKARAQGTNYGRPNSK